MSTFSTDTSSRARSAALRSWAFTDDRAQRTAAGRTAFLLRFERLVDPEGSLSPGERHKRAEALKKAHFIDLATKSAAARRKGGVA